MPRFALAVAIRQGVMLPLVCAFIARLKNVARLKNTVMQRNTRLAETVPSKVLTRNHGYAQPARRTAINWLVMSYQLPAEPAAKRTPLRRPLLGIGAVYPQNGICLLPTTDDHIRRLKIVENHIATAEGECIIHEPQPLNAALEAKVFNCFRAHRDDACREFIDKCGDLKAEGADEITAGHCSLGNVEENAADLQKFQGWIEKIAKFDLYAAERAGEARARLEGGEAMPADYARRVFEDRGKQGWGKQGWGNVAGAKMAGANVAGAKMAGANVAGAKMAGANVAGANVARANSAGARDQR